MSFLDDLQREIDRVAAVLSGPRSNRVGVAPPGGLPSVRSSGGGVPPFQAVQVARRVTLALQNNFISVNGNSVHIPWDTITDQFGNLFTLAAPTSILIPPIWEGGGLLVTGCLLIFGNVGDTLIAFLQRQRGAVATLFGLGGAVVPASGGPIPFPIAVMDPEPRPGDTFDLVILDSTNNANNFILQGVNPPLTGGLGSYMSARQIFPL